MDLDIGLEDKYNYIILSEMIDVQEMLDLLKQEGIYEIYKTKKYRGLNKEMLYGVYLVVLATIKLTKEYRKTGISSTTRIKAHNEETLFRIELTREYDVRKLGKEHMHEFLDYVMREHVKVYRGTKSTGVIPERICKARRTEQNYAPAEIRYLLVLLRTYYGRYSGREEFDIMVNGMLDEFTKGFNGDKKETYHITMMVKDIMYGLKEGTWWKATKVVNGWMKKTVSIGLTDRDKRESKKMYQLFITELNKVM